MIRSSATAPAPSTQGTGQFHRSWSGRLTMIGLRIGLRIGTVVFVLFFGVAAFVPQSGAASPDPPVTALTLQDPFGEYVNRLAFDVTSIDPALVTAGGPTALTITGTMTNTGPEALTNLAYRFQRGPALSSTADVRQELSSPSEPSAKVQDQFTQIGTELVAGASMPFVFTVPITSDDGLAVDAKGVYPLMVNVNGAVTLEGGPLEARIGELHLLLTVMGVPGSGAPDRDAVGSGQPAGNPGQTSAKPLPVNFVWPLVDQPHLGVGGIFLNDDLTAAISPGGRLSTLVDGLLDPAAARPPDGSVTAVVDPQLLDELDRMTRDYRVLATPGDPQPQMTEMLQAQTPPVQTEPAGQGTAAAGTAVQPTGAASTDAVPTDAVPTDAASTGATASQPPTNTSTAPPTVDPGSSDIPGTVPGTGQAAATSFLERLREVAARYPVLVLPYGDPDVVALVRAGLNGEVSAAVEHGQEVAERVLGPGSTTTGSTAPALDLNTMMAFPIDGAADGPTLNALRAAGLQTALLSEDSVNLEQPKVAAAQVAVPSPEDAAGSSPLPSAIAQSDVLTGVDVLIDQGKAAGWAMRVNALTGVLAQQTFDGVVTPAVFVPDRRWSPDAPGLRVLTDLLATLGTNQVITGASLAQLPQTAKTPASPAYPEQAQSRELSAEYLDRIRASRLDIASLRQTLGSVDQTTDPDLVLDPLDEALDTAASTAFRVDPAVGEANLGTVEAATAGIRSGVEISSAGNSYTLASSSSPLVLTVQNNTPYNAPVQVKITGGDRVGLTVTDPPVQIVPAGRSQQVKIPAEVSRSGQFQVSAQLVGEDGQAWGPPVQLAVESTAYGALTVILIAVAGGVLVLMVVLRIVQRLRGKGDGPAVGLTPKGPLGRPRMSPGPDSDSNRQPAEHRVGDEDGHAALRQVLSAPAAPSSADALTAKITRPSSADPPPPTRTDQVRTDRP